MYDQWPQKLQKIPYDEPGICLPCLKKGETRAYFFGQLFQVQTHESEAKIKWFTRFVISTSLDAFEAWSFYVLIFYFVMLYRFWHNFGAHSMF